ncbi:MAG TPA: protein kinase [Candidatus Binataceae bacterium]|nr:protein kinase [Candidatus Binataceae bacterium]
MITANTIVGGRYRVVSPLGGGGMKMVYLAEDLRLASRPCALAEMVDSFTSPDKQQDAVAAFQREADMLATLSNEHIPRVFDRFSEENRHYLVMEYIEGQTLEDRLREAGGKLAEPVVIDIALQICDTLAYLHNLSPPVIYRDLKPSNVMIAAHGQVKLIDFGIARHFAPMQNATMIGTQGYAPPEQYRGRVELRSDLYALAATMHHALSGRDPAAEPPFSFPPLRSAAPGVNPALAELVDQTLNYDAALRPQDVVEFKTRLAAIKSGAVSHSRSGAGVATAPPPVAPQANSSRPQMRLPLGGSSARAAASPSAPTLLSELATFGCPRCGRQVPANSRYCSFCAAPILAQPGGDAESAAARTMVLGDFPEPLPLPNPSARWRRPRGWQFYILIVAALFSGAFVLTTMIAHLAATAPEEPAPDAIPMPPSIPDLGGGASPEQLQALRRELDFEGYKSVRFKLEEDTLILWGTVPTEWDRANIRFTVLRVTGIVSVVDHLQTRDAFNMP